jgi:hypothetical protein
MYLRLLPQRGRGEEPIDCEQLVRDALEAAERSYADLAQLLMAFNDDSAGDHRLITMLAQARNANNVMLASLRHPSGGGA